MKIAAVTAIPVRLQRDRGKAEHTAGSPTALAGGGANYRWSAVFPALYAVNFETALVRITLDDGTIGWGEAQAPLAPEVACSIVQLLLAPVLRNGEFDGSVECIEMLWDRMYATMRIRGQTGGFMLDAISGVDLALWDLAGKLCNKPVCALLCGSRQRTEVPAYLSGLSGASIEARVENACAWRDEGFRAFKLFYDCESEEFLTSFSAVRKALGDQAGIAADALWRLSGDNAEEFGKTLDRHNAMWLEAPLPPEDPLAHAALARAIRTPLAIGESYRTRYELASFFREHAMRYVQPDLGRCGLTEGLRIARIAAERGVAVAPHLSIALGPQIAAAIHFAAALPNCEMLEFNPNVLEVANESLTQPIVCQAGCYRVPELPGLGAEVQLPLAK